MFLLSMVWREIFSVDPGKLSVDFYTFEITNAPTIDSLRYCCYFVHTFPLQGQSDVISRSHPH